MDIKSYCAVMNVFDQLSVNPLFVNSLIKVLFYPDVISFLILGTSFFFNRLNSEQNYFPSTDNRLVHVWAEKRTSKKEERTNNQTPGRQRQRGAETSPQPHSEDLHSYGCWWRCGPANLPGLIHTLSAGHIYVIYIIKNMLFPASDTQFLINVWGEGKSCTYKCKISIFLIMTKEQKFRYRYFFSCTCSETFFEMRFWIHIFISGMLPLHCCTEVVCMNVLGCSLF